MHRTAATLALAVLLLTAGCSMHSLPGQDPPRTATPVQTGVAVSVDAPDSVGRAFETVSVTTAKLRLHRAGAPWNESGWTTRFLQITTVDLASAAHGDPLTLGPVPLPADRYDAVAVPVRAVDATLADGRAASVTWENKSLRAPVTVDVDRETVVRVRFVLTLETSGDGYVLRAANATVPSTSPASRPG
ncbi:MAG: hypothetical protein ABEJ42_01870 [Halobacteriaceae archaeon]